MTIKEFTELFHFSKDTVRYYREKGILHPEQNENNGYFNYSANEAAVLYQIAQSQKFKCNPVSVIDKNNDEQNKEIMFNDLNSYYEADKKIDEEILRLKEMKKSIQSKIKYREELMEKIDKIEINQNSVGLYYYTLDQFKEYPEIISHLFGEFKSYIGISIALDQFTNNEIKEYKPIFCVGVTTNNFELCLKKGINLVGYRKIKDNQTSLRCIKKIDSLNQITSNIFDDVKQFAKENKYTFIEDVTSIILTSILDGNYSYYILFRFVVEKS